MSNIDTLLDKMVYRAFISLPRSYRQAPRNKLVQHHVWQAIVTELDNKKYDAKLRFYQNKDRRGIIQVDHLIKDKNKDYKNACLIIIDIYETLIHTFSVDPKYIRFEEKLTTRKNKYKSLEDFVGKK